MELLALEKDANNWLYAGGKDLGFLKQDQHGNVVFESLLKNSVLKDNEIEDIGNILAIGNDIYFRSFDKRILRAYDGSSKKQCGCIRDSRNSVIDRYSNIVFFNFSYSCV